MILITVILVGALLFACMFVEQDPVPPSDLDLPEDEIKDHD
jgi:hypothetical protein